MFEIITQKLMTPAKTSEYMLITARESLLKRDLILWYTHFFQRSSAHQNEGPVRPGAAQELGALP